MKQIKIKHFYSWSCSLHKAFIKRLNNQIHFNLGHCMEVDLRDIKNA